MCADRFWPADFKNKLQTEKGLQDGTVQTGRTYLEHLQKYDSTIVTASDDEVHTTKRFCSVPGCVNMDQKWIAEFPRDKDLRERWIAAIQLGTGQCLLDASIKNGGMVCDAHFSKLQMDDTYEYREPSLFERDHLRIKVASCRLCYQYDTVDCMFDQEFCLEQGYSLQWMINKYSLKLLQTATKEHVDDRYLCLRCTVRIDMTHAFWQEISDKTKNLKRLLRKMDDEKLILKKPDPYDTGSKPQDTVHHITKREVEPTNDYQQAEEVTEFVQDLIVKEEPKLAEPNHPEAAPKLRPTLKEQMILNQFKCYICQTIMEDKTSLMQHLITDHSKTGPYRCEECHKSFKLAAYNMHLAKHDSSRRLKCNYCSIRFNWDSRRKYHENIKHGIDHGELYEAIEARKAQNCDTNGEICENNLERVRHVLEQQGTNADGEVQRKTYLRCKTCNKTFATVRNLQRHVKGHSQDRPAKSDKPLKQALFKCYICSTTLECKPALVQHLITGHTIKKPYRCEECNLSFFQITAYNIHLSKHDSSRPFKCSICPVRFNRDTYMMYHEAALHGIDHGMLYAISRERKKLRCATCGISCASIRERQRHESMQHGVAVVIATGQSQGYTQCEICNKSFATVRNLERHMKIHRNEKPFECKHCDSCFREKDQLRVHERVHSGVKPLLCSGCGESFGAPTQLYRHKKRCLPNTSG